MAEKVKIFISYSHKDLPKKSELESHLSVLVRTSNAEIWADHVITPGQEWSKEIAENLNNSNMVLLLLTSNFIQSDFCYTKEMMDAIERHKNGLACVIPILVEDFYWQDPSFKLPFKDLQLLPLDNSVPKPVMSFAPPETGYSECIKGITRAMLDLQKNLKAIKNRSVEERKLKIQSLLAENKLDEASSELMDFIRMFCSDKTPESEQAIKDLSNESIMIKGKCTMFSTFLKDPSKAPPTLMDLYDSLMTAIFRLLEKVYNYVSLLFGRELKT